MTKIFKNIPMYKKSELRYLCEKLIPLTSLMTAHYGSVFCPFHHNTNTPAASLFKDPDDTERLYCYACKRQYTSYDYIELVLEESPITHLLKVADKETMDNMLKYRIDKYEVQTSKFEFTTIENLLNELYNFDEAIPL